MDALVEWMRERSADQFEARALRRHRAGAGARVRAVCRARAGSASNTCVINAELGSWLFLSEIICSLPLEPDAPALDQCGTCRLCLDACPTGALVESTRARRDALPVVPDDRGRGARFPNEDRDAVGAHAYGCDICQEVCPWNLQPAATRRPDSPWLPRRGVRRPVAGDAVADAGSRAARCAEEERDDARRRQAAPPQRRRLRGRDRRRGGAVRAARGRRADRATIRSSPSTSHWALERRG